MPVSLSDTKLYYLLYKPYDVLCQFTDSLGRKTLKDFGPFPRDVYSVGRLDLDSEGLLLLTNDNEVNHRLTEPEFEHPRTYLVQVEGIPSQESIERLKGGVIIQGEKTKPAEVRLLEHEPQVPPRTPPIRERKSIPASWVEMTLREGRNRQVRKMTAAVGHPTLRLIRTTIGELTLGGLKPGDVHRLSETEGKNLRKFVGL
ncbi:MAG TPA: pseudouridine synthase [Bacteroidota bacterium]|nr:pseudouridine synthase [Bacteroidota bacterium]